MSKDTTTKPSGKPEPKFKLSPEELEKVRLHSLGELKNLKEQINQTGQEAVQLDRRRTELQAINQQLQGAVKELYAFSLACGVDLHEEEAKLAKTEQAQTE